MKNFPFFRVKRLPQRNIDMYWSRRELPSQKDGFIYYSMGMV
jgi:hypothetical protein